MFSGGKCLKGPLLFFKNCRTSVPGINSGVFRQDKYFVGKGFHDLLEVSGGTGFTRTIREYGVASNQVVSGQEAYTSRSVTRGMQYN